MPDLPLENIIFAFSLTLFAGLATGVGSLMAFFSKSFNHKFLSVALGFSAGVMIFLSFVEILPKAKEVLSKSYDESLATLWTFGAFFTGIAIMAFIDYLIPSYENPHEIKNMDPHNLNAQIKNKKLLRMGLFSALVIALHNFPEGLATFMAALSDPVLGFSIAIAIAIHNIPEGIAVSVPIYYATKNKNKAFAVSFFSGLAEPLGALFGFLVLWSFFTDAFFGVLFASVAGIMVYISLDELLPTAEEYGEHHLAVTGLIAGMFLMAVSLLLIV